MPLKKIRDLDPQDTCTSSEHNPPSHMVYSPGVPEERTRRIEVAARAFYEPAQPHAWVIPTVLLRNMTRAFAVADEAVPVVSRDAHLAEVERVRENGRAGWSERDQQEDRALRAEKALRTIRDYQEDFGSPPPDDEMKRIAREVLGDYY